MEIRLIESLRCPYCSGGFRIARDCEPHDGRLRYGLLECRCFTFPVVDGILLLNLSKGNGDAQDVVQPYVPLQVAAIQHLARNDVPGLLAWMRQHIPLAAKLIESPPPNYLDIAGLFDKTVAQEAERYLGRMGQYGVIGWSRRQQWKQRLKRLLATRSRVTGASEDAELASYYVSRFFSPRVNALALYLGHLPVRGRVLSLCCGHGVFENLLQADGRAEQVVSMDGMLLNLLITRRYSNPNGVFICHDLQFPLPFADGFFDGVFSSSCLPEIPAQRSFVSEAIRVSAQTGWTVFDSIWNTELGVRRVSPVRHYRFCQNFFAKLDDYLSFFDELSRTERQVGLNVPGSPEAYITDPGWAFGVARDQAMASRSDPQINVLIIDRDHFPGFAEPRRPWMTAARLCLSPAYEARMQGQALQLRCRAPFANTAQDFAQASFPGYSKQLELDPSQATKPDWLMQQYVAGTLSLLPRAFSARHRPLGERAANA